MLYGYHIDLGSPEDYLTAIKRVKDVKRAFAIGQQQAPTEIYNQTGYAVSEFLSGILPALLQICMVQAGSTALGAVVGGILGAAAGGVGAIPGAAEGAAVGFSVSATVLGWLGLAFLFVAVGSSLVGMASLLQHAVVRAWQAADHPPDQRSQEVQQAGRDIARAMGMLMLLILQAIVAWLLKKGLDKLPELIAELRQSKLGQGFAEWVEKNAAKLYEDPKLRPKQAQGSTTKAAAEAEAQSPSQLAKREQAEEAAPQKPRPLDEHKVPCFNPYDKPKFQQMSPADQKAYLKEMSEQLQRQQDEINSLSADQYKAARDAYQSVGRNPAAEAAQASYRDSFAATVRDNIRDSLRSRGMGAAQAKTEAAAQTKEVMSKLAALHEPDMIAGGWATPDPKAMGRTDVNSSIGASWNQKDRIAGIDSAANDAIGSGRGGEKMNVKLEPCRGRGVK